MAILTRNITGADVLAIRKTISDDGPLSKEDILNRYFPGDASEPSTADQRKPLTDAIEFLRETEQITEADDGFVLTDGAAEFDDPGLALLHGIRTAKGDDAAYNNALEYLASQSDALVDRTGGFLDEMNERFGTANWNKQKLHYWARVMGELGVTRSVNGSNSNLMIALDRSLGLRLLVDVTEGERTPLREALQQIDERYLPVLTDTGAVATYIARLLTALDEQGHIQLSTISDIGQSIAIGGTTYSAIEVMTNE
jgi:hypothetical protein